MQALNGLRHDAITPSPYCRALYSELVESMFQISRTQAPI